ncbi:MAG: response regulator transcription factor [Verrucomicrobia bacterium]|nr:response regulator transcription factor [Verrucomicrobiota bacterium]
MSAFGDREVKILLVDDHAMFREHLAQLIAREEGLKVCGEAESVSEAMEVLRHTMPDLAIVDITLRGSSGLKLVEKLGKEAPGVKVLVLSMHPEALYGERAIQAGARGYLTKHQTSRELVEGIRRVLAGEIFLNPQAETEGTRNEELALGIAVADLLSGRELEVFSMLGRGKGTREIAAILGVSDSTVETYRFRIREKLGLRSAAQLYVTAGTWVREQAG